MAENCEFGQNENGEEFNTISFLDTSDAVRQYEVCGGPVSEGEKAYLLRRGFAFEDSSGELYGEPSTIIDSEDSDDSLVKKRISDADAENMSSNQDDHELDLSSGMVIEHGDLCLSEGEGSIDKEKENSSPLLPNSNSGGSPFASVSPTSCIQEKMDNDCGQQCQSLGGKRQGLGLLPLPVNTTVPELAPPDHASNANRPPSSSLEILADINSLVTTISGMVSEFSKDQTSTLYSLDNSLEDQDEQDLNLPVCATNCTLVGKQLSQPETQQEDVETCPSPAHDDTIVKLQKGNESMKISRGRIVQNAKSSIRRSSPTSKQDFNKILDESSSSGEEFDDTITRMEKILAMAEEQEKMANTNNFNLAPDNQNVDTEVFDERQPTPKYAVAESLVKTQLAESIEEKSPKPLPLSPLEERLDSGAGTKITSTCAKLTRAGGSSTGLLKPTRIPSPLARPDGLNMSASHPQTLGLGIKGQDDASTKSQLGPCRPKTSDVAPADKTTKSSFFTSPTLRLGAASLSRGVFKTAWNVSSPVQQTPTAQSQTTRNKNFMNAGEDSRLHITLPSPSALLLRIKKQTYFESPRPMGFNAEQSGHRKSSSSISTPLKPLVSNPKSDKSGNLPVSQVNTNTSPVAKTRSSLSSRFPPIPLPKCARDKLRAEAAALKRNNNVSSPVAAYIHSTPTPRRIQRVVPTSAGACNYNSVEKKGYAKVATGIPQPFTRLGTPKTVPELEFSRAYGFTVNGINATKVLKASDQNIQTNASRTPTEECKPLQPRLLKPIQYYGSDKIRELTSPPYTTSDACSKGIELKVQRHLGIVDENTNATIVEEEHIKKAFVPGRVEGYKKT